MRPVTEPLLGRMILVRVRGRSDKEHAICWSGSMGIRILLLLIALSPAGWGQRYFATVVGGIATLEADAATRVDSTNAASLYKPENGAALNVAVGVHLNDWFSVQANYIWNQNDLTITEIVDSVHLQQDRHSSEHAVIADLLLYFRSRRSRIRPYLSAGTGFVRMFSTAARPVQGPSRRFHFKWMRPNCRCGSRWARICFSGEGGGSGIALARPFREILSARR